MGGDTTGEVRRLFWVVDEGYDDSYVVDFNLRVVVWARETRIPGHRVIGGCVSNPTLESSLVGDTFTGFYISLQWIQTWTSTVFSKSSHGNPPADLPTSIPC